ncbi:hypothetical protein H9P43_006364 [Blastocladiella emersonii ATCC 22665]|nr:hypothetical protein H9P43_006364 [Blastocladiella emersonii ATCC 22665]
MASEPRGPPPATAGMPPPSTPSPSPFAAAAAPAPASPTVGSAPSPSLRYLQRASLPALDTSSPLGTVSRTGSEHAGTLPLPPAALAAAPAAAPATARQRTALFEVGLGPRLELDQVYWNGLHALHRFDVRNVTAEPIVVRLRSNLAGQVAFQLNNENLPDYADEAEGGDADAAAAAASSSAAAPAAASAESATPTSTAPSSVPSSSRGRARGANGNALTPHLAEPEFPTYSGPLVPPSARRPPPALASASASVGGSAPGTFRRTGPGSSSTSSLASSSASGMSLSSSSVDSLMFDPFASSTSSLDDSSTVLQPPAVPPLPTATTTRAAETPVTALPPATPRAPPNPLALVSTTNTATAAALGAYASTGFGGAHEFNQLFNFVNHIDEIRLDPGESRKVILAFLPEPTPPASTAAGSAGGNAGDGASVDADKQPASSVVPSGGPPPLPSSSASGANGGADDDASSTYDFTEVAGLLMFYGYRTAAPAAAAASCADEPAAATESPTELVPRTPTTATTTSGNGAPAAKADCNIVVKLKARVCKSVLWTDVAHQGLLFEDCVLGGTFIRDFTVWNRSEIDLYWTLNTADVSHALTFTDYNTGEPLDTTKPIPAYSYCRVHVTYKPKHLGDFSYDIQLENANDAENVEVARIHCVVRSALRDESLVVLSGHQLDFGDVCAGQWNTANLVLKNVSESPMEVKFACEGAAAADVLFNVLHPASLADAFLDQPAPTERRATAASSHGYPRGSATTGGGGTESDAYAGSSGAAALGHGAPTDENGSEGDPATAGFGALGPLGLGLGLGLTGDQLANGGTGGNARHLAAAAAAGLGADWANAHLFRTSSASSRTSSPIPSRSVSVDVSLADLAAAAARSGMLGSVPPIPPVPALPPPPTAVAARRGTAVSALADDDDDDSDSESMVSTRSMRSAGSAIANGGLGGHATALMLGGTGAPGSTPASGAVSMGSSAAAAAVATAGPGGILSGSMGLFAAAANAGMLMNGGSTSDLTGTPTGTSAAGNGAASNGGRGGSSSAGVVSPPRRRGPQHIEELVLKPGAERTIVVSYNPEKAGSATDFNAGSLVKRSFRVVLQHDRERKVIQCKARTCTSFIAVAPNVVSFGDTDVGTLKSQPVRITNLSDIAARVSLAFASKVLSCHRDEIRIAPRQSVEVKIDIYPRKVNPDYRKQITVMNLLNRDNDQIVEVRSTNIDKQRITWHSFFYRIMTPSSTNYLDFGCVVGNHYALRTFNVQNISNANLTLHITSSSENVFLYLKRRTAGPRLPDLAAKKLMLGAIADRKTIKRTHSESLVAATAAAGTPAYLDLAVSKKSAAAAAAAIATSPSSVAAAVANALGSAGTSGAASAATTRPSSAAPARNDATSASATAVAGTSAGATTASSSALNAAGLPAGGNPGTAASVTSGVDTPSDSAQATPTGASSVDEVTGILQRLNIATLPSFPANLEAKFVRLTMALRKSLDALIRSGELVPITGNRITIPPRTEVECVAVLNAPGVKDRRRKLDARLLFALVDFDASALPTSQTVLPVREFLVRCVVCPSALEVGQRNINFGNVELQTSMLKTMVVRNKSDVPLLYAIKKSGSIASGDVVLRNRLGVIPPHGAREVSFTFQPSMPGLFFEKLTVENVMNNEASQVISLKANVRKPDAFSIHTESIDMGVVMVGEASAARIITLHNTHKHPRSFTVRAGDEDAADGSGGANANALQWEFAVLSSATMEHGVQDAEEKIEALEQKLKIAKRKGRKDKVDKITETISKLRRGAESFVSTAQDDEEGGSSDAKSKSPAPTPAAPVVAPAPATTTSERKVGTLTLPVEPFAIMRIAVYVRPRPWAAVNTNPDTAPPPSTPVPYSGFIYVHQHRNTDMLKRVAYSCTACYDQAAFDAALASLEPEVAAATVAHRARTLSEHGAAAAARSVVASESTPELVQRGLEAPSAPVAPASPVPAAVSASAAPLAPAATTPSPTASQPPAPPQPASSVALETPVVDVGKFVIGQPSSFYFVLVNPGPAAGEYSTDDPAVAPADQRGSVTPGERRIINASVTPTRSGRQSYSVTVATPGSAAAAQHTFTVNFTGVYREGLSFAVVESPATGSVAAGPVVQEVDLGYCYNTKRFAVRAIVVITNTMPERVAVSAASTLAQQVTAFADPECTAPLADAVLDPGAQVRAFLAVMPNLAQPTLAMGKKSLVTFESRHLVGGFKFTSSTVPSAATTAADAAVPVLAPVAAEEICSQHLKFQAVIGPSVFSVSSTFINLGCVAELAEIGTQVTVINLSERMPLHYTVHTSNPDLIKVHDYPPVLRGAASGSAGSPDSPLPPPLDTTTSPRACVSLTVCPRAFGYLCETIYITNVNCPDQVTAVVVTLLVDPRTISLRAPASLPAAPEAAGSTNSLPLVQWDHIYVHPPAPSAAVAAAAAGTPLPALVKATAAADDVAVRSLHLTNRTDRMLRLVMYSDSLVSLTAEPADGVMIDAPATASELAQTIPLLGGRGQLCGPVITVAPGVEWSCNVAAPAPPAQLSDDDLQTLQLGKTVKVRGVLALCDLDALAADQHDAHSSAVVVKVVELIGYYCISRVELAAPAKPPVAVQVRRGDRTTFSVTVKNTASCPTRLCVGASTPAIQYLGPDTLELEAFASLEVEFAVETTGLASGVHDWSVTLTNLNNAANELVVPVTAKITSLDLTVAGRDLDESNVLTLPSLLVPNLAGSQIDSWFTLGNPTAAEVRFTVGVELIQPLTPFVQLHVLSRFSNSPINWLTLPANGSIEVKVKAVTRDGAKLSAENCPRWLLDERGIQIGQVSVENDAGRFLVPIRAQLVEQSCFEVDAAVLQLVEGAAPATLTVTNLSPHHPLNLNLGLEFLHDVSTCEVRHPESVQVPAGSTAAVPVQLLRSEFTEAGDALVLHLQDADSTRQHRKSVRLRFTEVVPMSVVSSPTADEAPADASLLAAGLSGGGAAPSTPGSVTLGGGGSSGLAGNGSTVAASAAGGGSAVAGDTGDFLVIKGCSKRGRLYDLDLGQQDLGAAATVTRKLVIELHRPVKCSYRLRAATPDCAEWLSLSRAEGTLDPAGVRSQAVTLSFSTNVRNVFSTYLVLENLDFPHDVKYIKVSLEVLARVNVRKARAFDLVCNGLDDSPTIAYENVFYGQEYSSRSFTIVNREAIPLEFTFKLAGLPATDRTEVLFSTSKSIPKLFKTVVVPAESSTRVYLRLRPMRDPNGRMVRADEYAGATTAAAGAGTTLVSPLTAAAAASSSRPGSPETFLAPPLLADGAGGMSPLPMSPVTAAAAQQHWTAAQQHWTAAPFTADPADSDPLSSQQQQPPALTFPELEIKEFDIIVNCRLVRDYQQMIRVSATCMAPSMHISASDVTVAATLAADGASLMCPEPSQDLVVTNVSGDARPLDLQVMSDIQLFTVEVEGGQPNAPLTLAPGASIRVRVTLNGDEAARQIDTLRREKYFQGYFVVYNRGMCHERTFVTVKLSLGYLPTFSLVWWTGQRSATFSALEARVVECLRCANAEPSALLLQAQPWPWPGSWRAAVASGAAGYDEFYFAVRFAVDQLVYMATISTASDHVLQLAALFFSGLMAHYDPALPGVWLDTLRYFLTFFTAPHPVIDSLRRLYLFRVGQQQQQGGGAV